MEPSRAEEKGTKMVEGVEEDEEEEEEEDEKEDDEDGRGERKRRALNSNSSGKKGSYSGWVAQPSCQAENCSVDMTEARRYHRRHKVCEFHSKAPVVRVAGLHQRFCQQCSRFHELKEFDDAKRSCRRRLAGHNRRRRKSTYDSFGEGSN